MLCRRWLMLCNKIGLFATLAQRSYNVYNLTTAHHTLCRRQSQDGVAISEEAGYCITASSKLGYIQYVNYRTLI